MAKSGNQKGKLLYLAEIFHRETDEAHGLTLAELTERLAAYGVQAERKTLYADHGGAAALRAGHRQLEGGTGVPLPAGVSGSLSAGAKLLVDAVQASRFTRRASPAVSSKSWSRWSASTTPGSCSGRYSSPGESRP